MPVREQFNPNPERNPTTIKNSN
jgi:hypothetical protein